VRIVKALRDLANEARKIEDTNVNGIFVRCEFNDAGVRVRVSTNQYGGLHCQREVPWAKIEYPAGASTPLIDALRNAHTKLMAKIRDER
jgi:hypothetical protein